MTTEAVDFEIFMIRYYVTTLLYYEMKIYKSFM